MSAPDLPGVLRESERRLSLSLWVGGVPKPQGSVKAWVQNGKARITHANKSDLAAWRNAVGHEAQQVWGDHPALDTPVGAVMWFYLPRPASAPKRVRCPARKPDLDKLVRAVLDSLTGIVFTDDARVCSLAAHKLFGTTHPTGLQMQVWELEP